MEKCCSGERRHSEMQERPGREILRNWEDCGEWNLLPVCPPPPQILFHHSPRSLQLPEFKYCCFSLQLFLPRLALSGRGLKLKYPVHLKASTIPSFLSCPLHYSFFSVCPSYLLLLLGACRLRLLPPSPMSFHNFSQPQTFSPPLLNSLFCSFDLPFPTTSSTFKIGEHW